MLAADKESSQAATTSSPSPGSKSETPSVESIYTKLTLRQHILARPDSYISSIDSMTKELWVVDRNEEGEGEMKFREVKYVPGLYKIFGEIVVNASDNKQRDRKMDTIKIDIRPGEGYISIWNNGNGLPTVKHRGEGVYVRSLIFGHLVTSSNFNNDDKKLTGGRSGYGAKLCNIYSTRFVVETYSRTERTYFQQVWTNNMSSSSEPILDFRSEEEDYTKITFYPDLSKFKMDALDADTVALM